MNVVRSDGSVDSFGLPCRAPVAIETGRDGLRLRMFDDGRGPSFGAPAGAAPIVAPVEKGHVLVAPPEQARVRGGMVVAGCCHLLNGDVIECGGAAWRYSSADFVDPERAEPFVHPNPGGSPVQCAYCMHELEPGETSTYCPACGFAFHQQCLAGGQVAECPMCSCPVCTTDEQRQSFAREHG